MADDKKFDYIRERLDTVVDRVHEVQTSLQSHAVNFQTHAQQDEQMAEQLKVVSNTLHENTSSLKDHMRRTDLLESYMKSMDSRFSPIEMEQMRKRAVAIWWQRKIRFTAKLGGAMTALGGIGMLVKHLIHILGR